jgi:hypothetical protein
MKKPYAIVATVLTGASLPLIALYCTTPSAPSLDQPSPYFIALSMFFVRRALHSAAALGSLVPLALFCAFLPSLFRGSGRVPARMFALSLLVTVLNIAWYLWHWHTSDIYQGPYYVAVTILVNILCAVCLCFAAWRGRTRDAFGLSLAVHWGVFAWLSSYALPYLGEHL